MLRGLHVFQRVVIDILPDFVIVPTVTNTVVVKRFLPDCTTSLFADSPFELLYYTGYCRGDLWSPAFVCTYLNVEMNMVGHDTVFIHFYCGVYRA